MQSYLHGRDLIGDLDFSKEEVETVLDVAFDLKRKRALNEPHAYLRDKVLAMLFFFSSTRTRGSFEAGMAQLGGHGAFIDSNTTQISHGDTPKEIGEIFGRYFDGIAIRHCDWHDGNKYLNAVAQASRVPVLNMQCDIYHPFQCLTDLMTIIEKKGRDLRKKKMVVSWAYAESYLKPISVPQSLILQDAALRHGCGPGLPAGVQAHAGDRRPKYIQISSSGIIGGGGYHARTHSAPEAATRSDQRIGRVVPHDARRAIAYASADGPARC